jgi:hypothetical protein
MERDEVLKSLGFSDRFLQALQEFEKVVPNVYYDIPFYDSRDNYSSIGDNDPLIIERPNDGYNQNIIIRQA